MMHRRTLFKTVPGAVASGAALPRSAVAQGRAQRVLRFVPQANLSSLDPITTTAYVVRNHGYMAYDTLFGTDEGFVPRPQMAEGAVEEDDGRSGPSRCATGSASTTASRSGRGTPPRASGAG
jgi:peptide/nickel transport system substrate-binding protein